MEQLLRSLKAAEGQWQRLASERDHLGDAIRKHEIQRATLEQQRVAAEEKRASASAEREHAVVRMEGFVAKRLFEEIDPEVQPARDSFSATATATATAAVELARGLEKQLKYHPTNDERWHRLQSEIVQNFHEFSDQLGRWGLMPQLDVTDESNVSVIECEFQGAMRPIRELSQVLRDELASWERVFEEREREVIENHLIGEAAYALQESIRDGEQWVRKVNDELADIQTSSGIQLRFKWEVSDPADEALSATRSIFLKSSATWSPAERDQIGAFLQERIRVAREVDETAAWRNYLQQALDYRAWHRLGIWRKQQGDASWKKLTKRTFGTGSGGVKAMTLTVPQFAAAAAHYQNADPAAPRLILLDEVFAGIDTPTRAPDGPVGNLRPGLRDDQSTRMGRLSIGVGAGHLSLGLTAGVARRCGYPMGLEWAGEIA